MYRVLFPSYFWVRESKDPARWVFPYPLGAQMSAASFVVGLRIRAEDEILIPGMAGVIWFSGDPLLGDYDYQLGLIQS